MPHVNDQHTIRKKGEKLKSDSIRFFHGLAHSVGSIPYRSWINSLRQSSNETVWLLGKEYDSIKSESLAADLKGRVYLSYRNGFPNLNGEPNSNSDTGWGCMIRTSQMLLAQALLIQNLGRDWIRDDATPSTLSNIIRLFDDHTGPLGIHSFIKQAQNHGVESPVGRWYSPSEAFIIFRDIIHNSHNCLLGHISPLVCFDNLVALQDIEDASEGWTKNVLVVIPVRLGTQAMNDKYSDSLRSLFLTNNFMGAVGGRPKHSLYFVGTSNDLLLYLDPHKTQPYTRLDGNESTKTWDTYHSSEKLFMKLSSIDPSLALGFLITSKEDCELLIKSLAENDIIEYENSPKSPLFSVVKEKTVYNSLESNGGIEENGFELL
ncbi:unnamed protein product [Bursaphelenchus xylophilus]|uniref:Cysteine protease n=1 Tax=Bursaphelenchus xylophilus TaxID=6326 RepID=A0A1I7RPV7_BURXY|nr:unnamed protein product [Bursaphelenchus xylophilus]CAG9096694.1 unnamed protein product [Bursaphelenchus xylophilus]